MRLLAFILFVFFCHNFTLAQDTTELKNYGYQINWITQPKGLKTKKWQSNDLISKQAFGQLQKRLLLQLYALGYIEAAFSKIDTNHSPFQLYVSPGKRYHWKNLDPGNLDEGVLRKIGYRDKLYRNTPLSYVETEKLFHAVLTHYENNGYPFSSIRLDSVEINNGRITAKINTQLNQLIHIDTIIVYGDAKISSKYLSNYIGIKSGDPYNESLVRDLPIRIKELPFVETYRSAEVEFGSKRTKLYLYLNHKKANDFNGIIGFLPDDNTGELLITGDVKLKLQNGLGKGEVLQLNWKRLQTQTSDLKGRIQYPFVFNTPFGLDAALHIYRRDTTFSTTTTNLGVQYLFKGSNFFKIFWEKETSSLISVYNLEFATELPEYADIVINSIGFGVQLVKLNYRLNPTSGYRIKGTLGLGTKEIRQNPNINPEVYDSLQLKTNRSKSQFLIEYFIPIAQRHTALLRNQTGILVNENIFTNELFRIGGLKTLRGFDEESIFASSYSIFTLEYRFLLEQNSYFSLFYDQAWYENQSKKQLQTDQPFGFGAGVSFDTKIGIFSVSYALGKQLNNPIQFRAAKIHFGFVNFF